MTLFWNFKSMPLNLGHFRKLRDSEIHPLMQADLLFSEISRKRQLILETSQNFEKKTSAPNDCMFWIRTATNQVFQNEILLRNNKKSLVLIRALGDSLPQKAETIEEFCELIHSELNHLTAQHQECRETLNRLKRESQKNLESQDKKRVSAENIKSMRSTILMSPSPILEQIQAANIGQNQLAFQDSLAKLSINLNHKTISTELAARQSLEVAHNSAESKDALPLDHLEKAPPKSRPKVLAKKSLSLIQVHPQNEATIEAPIEPPNPFDIKPEENVLTEFAQFLSTVLKNP